MASTEEPETPKTPRTMSDPATDEQIVCSISSAFPTSPYATSCRDYSSSIVPRSLSLHSPPSCTPNPPVQPLVLAPKKSSLRRYSVSNTGVTSITDRTLYAKQQDTYDNTDVTPRPSNISESIRSLTERKPSPVAPRKGSSIADRIRNLEASNSDSFAYHGSKKETDAGEGKKDMIEGVNGKNSATESGEGKKSMEVLDDVNLGDGKFYCFSSQSCLRSSSTHFPVMCGN